MYTKFRKLNTKCSNKFKESYISSPFLVILFSKNLAQLRTAPHGPLTPCWVPEKTNEQIPIKFLDGMISRPIMADLNSLDPSSHSRRSSKRINQLRGIALHHSFLFKCVYFIWAQQKSVSFLSKNLLLNF